MLALFGYGGPNCGYEVTDMETVQQVLTPTLSNGNNTIIADTAFKPANRPAGCEFLNVFSNALNKQAALLGITKQSTNDNQVGNYWRSGSPVGKNPELRC